MRDIRYKKGSVVNFDCGLSRLIFEGITVSTGEEDAKDNNTTPLKDRNRDKYKDKSRYDSDESDESDEEDHSEEDLNETGSQEDDSLLSPNPRRLSNVPLTRRKLPIKKAYSFDAIFDVEMDTRKIDFVDVTAVRWVSSYLLI